MDAQFLQNNQKRVTEIPAAVTLRYCVMNAIFRTKDHSMNEYMECMQYAIDCVRDMRLYNEASIEVAYLIPNEAGIVEFPADAIDYTKIGIEIRGQLYNLTVNDNMVLNRAQKCGEDLRQMQQGYGFPASISSGYFYAPHFRGGAYYPSLYGVGGGFNTAYYRVDEKMRQIQFNGFIPRNEIIMEYKSTGLSAGTIVTPQLIPVIRTYILWQRIENDPRVSISEKQRKQDQYDQEVMKLRDYNNNFTLQEYLDMYYSTLKQGIKR
jgi:hypothetical protein